MPITRASYWNVLGLTLALLLATGCGTIGQGEQSGAVFTPPDEHAPAVRILPAELIPAQSPWADSNYHSMIVGSDDNVYFSLHTHRIDHHAQILRYVPGESEATVLADVGELVGESVDQYLPQGKVHTPIYEMDGKLYFATMLGYYKDDRQGKSYPGGHICVLDMATGEGRSLAQTEPEDGIISMTLDRERRRLYALTWPNGHLLDYDIDTGELRDLGPQYGEGERPESDDPDWSRISREIIIGPGGHVYASRIDGSVFEYDPDTGEVRDLPMTLESHGQVSMFRSGLYDPARERLLVLHQATSSLMAIDPVNETVEPLGEMAHPAIDDHVPNPFFTQLGIKLRGDTLWYGAHGPTLHITGIPKENQISQAYLLSYDLDAENQADALTNHGAIVVFDDSGMRRAFYAESVAFDDEGGAYIVASLEVTDPQRIETIREARQGATPAELAWATYEMQLLYIPPERIPSSASE